MTLSIQASGILKHHNVFALLIDGMADSILSVSQICRGELDETPKFGIFTDKVLYFTHKKVLKILLPKLKVLINLVYSAR